MLVRLFSVNNDLCVSPSDIGLDDGHCRPTWYRELVLVGAPVIIEKVFKVDPFTYLSALRPKEITALDVNFCADAGCRKNVSTHTQPSAGIHSDETRDILSLGRYPHTVVFLLLESSLLIFYKQLQFIPASWDVLQCNFCILLNMNGMDLN